MPKGIKKNQDRSSLSTRAETGNEKARRRRRSSNPRSRNGGDESASQRSATGDVVPRVQKVCSNCGGIHRTTFEELPIGAVFRDPDDRSTIFTKIAPTKAIIPGGKRPYRPSFSRKARVHRVCR